MCGSFHVSVVFSGVCSQCLYYFITRIIGAGVCFGGISLGWELKAYIASSSLQERAPYISLKLTASVKGPMTEWHKPHEAILVTVGSILEST